MRDFFCIFSPPPAETWYIGRCYCREKKVGQRFPPFSIASLFTIFDCSINQRPTGIKGWVCARVGLAPEHGKLCSSLSMFGMVQCGRLFFTRSARQDTERPFFTETLFSPLHSEYQRSFFLETMINRAINSIQCVCSVCSRGKREGRGWTQHTQQSFKFGMAGGSMEEREREREMDNSKTEEEKEKRINCFDPRPIQK